MISGETKKQKYRAGRNPAERKKIMSKRKYEKGALVKSMDDLFKATWFIVENGNHRKTQHVGWLTSMQARYVHDLILRRMLYFAVPIKEENKKGLQEDE